MSEDPQSVVSTEFPERTGLGDEKSIAMRVCLGASDARLLEECEVQPYRSSGPGGQKKNKTFSAVRIHHPGSGVTVVGTESRSQQENRARALKRLREAIALGFRLPLPERIVWPPTVQLEKGRLAVNSHNPAYLHILALALDAIASCKGRIGEAGQALGVTSSSLTRFLAENPKAWGEANRLRKRFGLGPLKN